MNCSNCKNQITEGAKFCKICGAAVVDVPKQMFCRNCGNQMNEGAQFCKHCGTRQEKKIEVKEAKPIAPAPPVTVPPIALPPPVTKIKEDVPPPVIPPLPPPPITESSSEKKGGALKYVLIGVALLCAVGAGLFFLAGKSDEKSAETVTKKVAETDEVKARVKVPEGDVLNLRAEPSADSEILFQFHNGTIVKVLNGERKGQWTKVEYGTYTGYVNDKYLLYSGESSSGSPSNDDATDLETVILKTIKAYQNQDEKTLNQLIHKDFGIVFISSMGMSVDISRSDKISFDVPVPKITTDNKVRFESLPDICDLWSKPAGIYCDTKKTTNILSRTAKLNNEIWDANWSSKDISKFEEIEKNGHSVSVVYTLDGGRYSFNFHLTLIDGKWYLTFIDRTDCSV